MELQQLLKECKKNSVTAQKYLFDHYAVSMFLLCRRYVKTDESAEEVMMNGFLKFFNSIQQFNYVNDAATLGWLKKITVNEFEVANYFMSLRSFKYLAYAKVSIAEKASPQYAI